MSPQPSGSAAVGRSKTIAASSSRSVILRALRGEVHTLQNGLRLGENVEMRSYRTAAAIPRANLAHVSFVLVAWVTCGIAAAGSWNAAMYEYFPNCGRQGAEDQSGFLINGILGGPMALVVALRDTHFARSGWSLSTHECAEHVQSDAFGIPAEYERRD